MLNSLNMLLISGCNWKKKTYANKSKFPDFTMSWTLLRCPFQTFYWKKFVSSHCFILSIIIDYKKWNKADILNRKKSKNVKPLISDCSPFQLTFWIYSNLQVYNADKRGQKFTLLKKSSVAKLIKLQRLLWCFVVVCCFNHVHVW